MISLQTNVNSLVAQQNLSVNSAFQSKTIAQLTSGYRINQSGDDAAGLAVANKFRSTVAELTQGVANGNDATAQLQIMDGGMSNISAILDRLKTLATQSASGTFTGNRITLNSEFQNDLLEIDRQAQQIGLNTGGAFAKSLDVYLGIGSGSASLQNGVVTLGLTQSAVDSQSLGMKGMQVVKASLTNGAADLVVNDLGVGKTNSVQNIVSNTGGNQMAIAGYAAFQFSGAGFSDTGKIGVSVNLAGVTDMNTLVSAVNSAIQQAGAGTTAAATAFKNSNIVASVYTDRNGGQALAFSSSTAAFQVQAGDQMGNALLGNVSSTVGTAVVGTAVNGVNTIGGNFANNQVVKMVVTGGGLASPITLTLNTAGGPATGAAITDIKNQFNAKAELQAAGLTMSGSSTPGSALSFASATGQKFNIAVTGDTADLLGLGSFKVGNGNEADYTTIDGAAYTAVTSATATTNAMLEFSFNGGAGVKVNGATGIDLTAGPSATAAIATSTGAITGASTGAIVTAAASLTLSINGVAITGNPITLASTQAAYAGQVVSTVTSGTWAPAGAEGGQTIKYKVDGSAERVVTLAAAGADDTAAALLGDLNAKLNGAHAFWDAGNGGKLTIVSNSTGAASKVEILGIVGGSGSAAGTGDGTLGLTAYEDVVASVGNKQAGNAATATLGDIATQIQTAINSAAIPGGAKVTVDSVNNTLSITTNNKGAGNSIVIGAGTGATLLNLTAQSNNGTNMNADDVVAALNVQFSSDVNLQPAALKATNTTGVITIASSNGTAFRINASTTGANAGIGFGTSGFSYAAALTSGTSMASLDAFGVSHTTAQDFTAMQYGSDKQALTFSATDSSGVLETATLTLQNNGASRSGRSIDDAVAYINQQLQIDTANPALRQIVAVKEIKGGAEGINFVSSLSNFTVGVSGNANGVGVSNGAATPLTSQTYGSGSNMTIDTQVGAKAAVSAIAAAVGILGSAQAAVGKGQNQLAYAVSLAQSQITNFSAAESQIRDANVAQQAANLSKAQVLSQASIAAMAQANSAPQAVLSLLRG